MPDRTRTALHVWMRKNHARLSGTLDRPCWTAVARDLQAAADEYAAGRSTEPVVLDKHGKAPTADNLRKTWWRVRREVAAGRPRVKELRMPKATVAPDMPPARIAGDPLGRVRAQMNARSGIPAEGWNTDEADPGGAFQLGEPVRLGRR